MFIKATIPVFIHIIIVYLFLCYKILYFNILYLSLRSNKKQYNMKTNVIMKSSDRNLFGVVIKQDTKTSFMSLTDLQEAYSMKRMQEGWQEKRIENILSNKSSAERIYYILSKRGYIKNKKLDEFIKEVNDTSLIKVLKKYKAYKTVGTRYEKRVSCDPYVWILVAMELNPMLYAETIMWLTDSLILNRIEAGDRYNTLSRSAAKLKDVDYSKMAKALNWIVFNQHETAIRNKASKEQLKELEELQIKLSVLIDMGYVKTFEELLEVMRKIYKDKHKLLL